ncbi:hypothetical protein POM88_016451 [Heracleum sosnowskyi]|uniref:TF-B3 domain-containing protein n=1 Tax=Heracleum sosnowskyi TaxID=360622 RepID=A0AAD8IP00_9APIA|nr:hypothetical protein POM88_016451 [Heracleum sosnowskyi]
MLGKTYEGPTLLSFLNGRHIPGRFVIELGGSSIDHKLHNVYIGNFSKSFSKDWTDGSISRLIAHKRQWRVLIKLKHNMCKLGSGWDKFIEDNDLGEGDSRPTIYDVMMEMIDKMGYAVKLVRITKRVHEAYFSQLYLTKLEDEAENVAFDLRPSDAINIAVRCKDAIV